MGDGSFYEGSFEHGEIQGHGFKRWALSSNSYTGQFERGELCGGGIMNYGNGDGYEGSWQNNQREGTTLTVLSSFLHSFLSSKKHRYTYLFLYFCLFTITGDGHLIETNGNNYKGSFHQHKRHGEGYQIFRSIFHQFFKRSGDSASVKLNLLFLKRMRLSLNYF